MRDFHSLYFCVSTLFMSLSVSAQQNCTLGVGGKNTETISKVFQLNEEQQATMQELIGELEIKNKLIDDQIKKLFDEHPQSTQEELETLAKKYKVLQQKMVIISEEYDKKLLSTFNERQYRRYVDLCSEVFRKPFLVTPTKYTDSIPSPE